MDVYMFCKGILWEKHIYMYIYSLYICTHSWCGNTRKLVVWIHRMSCKSQPCITISPTDEDTKLAKMNIKRSLE